MAPVCCGPLTCCPLQVDITKDVEGLTRFYRDCLYHNQRYVDKALTQKCVLPCTPLSVIKILEGLNVSEG